MPSMAEFVIVGAGLAGTTLAWAFVRRGRTIRLIDRGTATSTSRVAAGLLTPITGKKPAVSWRWHDLRAAADRFYQEVETLTGSRFFHPRPVVRVLTSDRERFSFERPDFTPILAPVDPTLDGDQLPHEYGAVQMATAAQLDVAGYLDASRVYFRRLGVFEEGDYRPRADDPHIVLCHGYDPETNTHFPLPFRAAKGEILTVHIPGFTDLRVFNRGGHWLAPTRTPAVYRFGATYSWDPLDNTPTTAGRQELEAKLRALIRLPFEVIGHDAGVRPIVAGRRPVIGLHPTNPRLAVFNGLSSKGSLTAPLVAEMLAAHLCDGSPIDPEVDVRLRTDTAESAG